MKEEGRLQAQICTLLRLRAAPNVLWWHPNNNPRSARDGSRLKKMGLRAGVSDLHFLCDEKFYSLELKVLGGRPTVPQLEWKDLVCDAGGYAAIAYGFESARAILKAWGIIR